MNTQHVFIIGSKGIPSQYGGFETFVDRLTEYEENLAAEEAKRADNAEAQATGNDNAAGSKTNTKIKYHVSCRTNYEDEVYEYHSAECFPVHTISAGAATAILYDMAAMKYVINYIVQNKIESPKVYILACRIGPFIGGYVRKIHRLGGKVFLNPDGFEWKRGKWPAPVKAYWKMSTKQMIKHADVVVCDSEYIREYVCDNYSGTVRDDVYLRGTEEESVGFADNPTGGGECADNSLYAPDRKEVIGKHAKKVCYVPYGADVDEETTHKTRTKYRKWLKENGLTEGEYYLTVSRLVPENNFETMIREYMKSAETKPFVLITTVNDSMKLALDEKLHYTQDARINFLPVVYDRELLVMIRQGAYGYFHGHEVGGTNPSLLEALAAGIKGNSVVMALNVSFNMEVCGTGACQGAYYWSKEEGSLSALIDSQIGETKGDWAKDSSDLGTEGSPQNANTFENEGELNNTNLCTFTRERIIATGVNRVQTLYNWNEITLAYRRLFLG